MAPTPENSPMAQTATSPRDMGGITKHCKTVKLAHGCCPCPTGALYSTFDTAWCHRVWLVLRGWFAGLCLVICVCVRTAFCLIGAGALAR